MLATATQTIGRSAGRSYLIQHDGFNVVSHEIRKTLHETGLPTALNNNTRQHSIWTQQNQTLARHRLTYSRSHDAEVGRDVRQCEVCQQTVVQGRRDERFVQLLRTQRSALHLRTNQNKHVVVMRDVV